MPTYTYTDKETGMQVRAKSDAPLEGASIDKLFAEAPKMALERLETGAYRYDENDVERDDTSRREQIRKLSAQALQVSPDDVDVLSGMGMWGRTKLSFQPTMQDKMKHLEDTYGNENVKALKIGDNIDFFYRDPNETRNKWVMVDEEGASFSDFTEAITGEAVPTAGALVGAAKGSAAGPLGAIGGAAAGYFATSAAQDATIRTMSGEDVDPLEIAKRRGIETVVGAVIDRVALGAGRALTKRFGKPAGFESIQQLSDDVQKLADIGLDIKIPGVLKAGEQAAQQARDLASIIPGSKFAQKLEGVRQTLYDYTEALKGNGANTADGMQRIMDDIVVARNELKGLIDNKGAGVKKALQELNERELSLFNENMGGQVVNTADWWRQTRKDIVDPAVGNIDTTNAANWAQLDNLAGGAKVVPLNEVRKSIDNALSDFIRLKSPDVNSLRREVAKRLDQAENVISFKEFREMMQDVQGAISRSKVAGFAPAEQVATKVSQKLEDLRGTILKDHPQLGQAFDTANNFYKDQYLGTKRRDVGKVLRESLADESLGDSAAAKTILGSPDAIQDILKVARDGGGAEAEQAMRDQLKRAYLSDRLNLNSNNIPTIKSFSLNQADRDIIQSIWGKAGVRNAEILSQRLKQVSDFNPLNVKPEEVDAALSALATDDVKSIASRIASIAADQKELDKVLNNTVLSKISKGLDGGWTSLDADRVAKALVDGEPTMVASAMKEIRRGPQEAVESFQQEFVGQLFAKFQSSPQKGLYGTDTLWNPKEFERLLRGPRGKSIEKNMVAVLGRETTDNVLRANRALSAVATRSAKEAEDAVRLRTIFPGFKLYLVGDVLGWARNRVLSVIYGSNLLDPYMKTLASTSSPEIAARSIDRNLTKIIGTSKFWQLVAREAENDPSVYESSMQAAEGLGAGFRESESQQ